MKKGSAPAVGEDAGEVDSLAMGTVSGEWLETKKKENEKKEIKRRNVSFTLPSILPLIAYQVIELHPKIGTRTRKGDISIQ